MAMQPDQPLIGNTNEPAKSGQWLGKSLAAFGALLAVIYLSNVGAGIFELIPDNIPLAGNVDEALFTLLLVFCLRKLGIDLLPHLGKRDG